MRHRWTLDDVAEGRAPSRMESYTPQEHDRAWGDAEDAEDAESYGICEECEMPVLFSEPHIQEGYARIRHWHTACFNEAREREKAEEETEDAER